MTDQSDLDMAKQPLPTNFEQNPANFYPNQPDHSAAQNAGYVPPHPGAQVQGGMNYPNQPNYSPQQPGYPLQQAGGYPQQGGYPPQQGGYPPQQGGYPPQQGGYPPQQGGYSPQQGGFYPPQNNIVIVQQQQPPPLTDWKVGLFDCFSYLDVCIIATFLPCVQYGYNAEKANPGQTCCEACFYYTIMAICCGCVMPCYLGQFRGQVRSKYNIIGSSSGDCCTHCFCNCCALVQENKEIELREAEKQHGRI